MCFLKVLKNEYIFFTYSNKTKKCLLKAFVKFLFSPHFSIIVQIRLLQMFNGSLKGRWLNNRIFWKYGVELPIVPNIGKNFRFAHLPGIVIGEGAIIGNNCIVYHGVTVGQSHGLYPRIGNNVIIYPHAQILGGINIGDNVTILANSVVVKDIPSNTIVGGIPAKIIKQK